MCVMKVFAFWCIHEICAYFGFKSGTIAGAIQVSWTISNSDVGLPTFPIFPVNDF